MATFRQNRQHFDDLLFNQNLIHHTVSDVDQSNDADDVATLCDDEYSDLRWL